MAAGMTVAARLSYRLGILPEFDLKRIISLLEASGLNVDIKRFSPVQTLSAMRHDKKVLQGNIRLILPESIGKTVITEAVTDADILGALS